MTDVKPIPLLQLEDKLQRFIASQLDFNDKLALSLVSKKSEKIVESLKIKLDRIMVVYKSSAEITLFTVEDYARKDWKFVMTGNTVGINKRCILQNTWNLGRVMTKQQYHVKDWYQHITRVFRPCETLIIFDLAQGQQVDLLEFGKVFGTFTKMTVKNWRPNGFELKAFNTIQPADFMLRDPSKVWIYMIVFSFPLSMIIR